MKTNMEYLFGPDVQFGMWFTLALMLLSVLLIWGCLKYYEEKAKRNNDAITAYKHREMNNADLYQRKH